MGTLVSSVRGAAVIAGGTLLEAVRNRLLHVALFFAVMLVGVSVAAASVSIWERSRLIIDVGLAAASGFGSIIALALTILSFAGEITKRTAYPVLVRPVPRWAFVLGKYLGVVLAMEILVTLMVLATALIVLLFGDLVPAAFFGCLWMTWVEMVVVCAIALLFSTLATPVLAATYTVGIVLAGNLSVEILALAQRAAGRGEAGMSTALSVAYYLLPDLGNLSLRTQAANALPIPDGFLLTGTLYGCCYAAAAVALAAFIFTRREAL